MKILKYKDDKRWISPLRLWDKAGAANKEFSLNVMRNTLMNQSSIVEQFKFDTALW